MKYSLAQAFVKGFQCMTKPFPKLFDFRFNPFFEIRHTKTWIPFSGRLEITKRLKFQGESKNATQQTTRTPVSESIFPGCNCFLVD
jgi:hypothetical protein